jgi:type IV secretory pathway VirB4 component
VEIENIRDDTVILKNGGLRQVVIVGGVNFSLKSEEEQNLITQSYQNFLNSLNFPIQAIIHSRKVNIEGYLQRLDRFKAQEVSGLLRDQITEYQEFVRGFIKDFDIMTKTFLVVIPYVCITIPTPSAFGGSIPFFGKKKTKEEMAAETSRQGEEFFHESLIQLRQRTTQVVQNLSAIGLEAMVLNTTQLTELFYNFYNPETIEKEVVTMPKK